MPLKRGKHHQKHETRRSKRISRMHPRDWAGRLHRHIGRLLLRRLTERDRQHVQAYGRSGVSMIELADQVLAELHTFKSPFNEEAAVIWTQVRREASRANGAPTTEGTHF